MVTSSDSYRIEKTLARGHNYVSHEWCRVLHLLDLVTRQDGQIYCSVISTIVLNRVCFRFISSGSNSNKRM